MSRSEERKQDSFFPRSRANRHGGTLFADMLDKGKRGDEIFSQEPRFENQFCLRQLLSEERNNSHGSNEAFPINALRRNGHERI